MSEVPLYLWAGGAVLAQPAQRRRREDVLRARRKPEFRMSCVQRGNRGLVD